MKKEFDAKKGICKLNGENPDVTAHLSLLIWILAACHSLSEFTLHYKLPVLTLQQTELNQYLEYLDFLLLLRNFLLSLLSLPPLNQSKQPNKCLSMTSWWFELLYYLGWKITISKILHKKFKP